MSASVLFTLILGLQFWINMKPYSNQLYGPTALPYTVGVTAKNTFIDQKTMIHKLRPGYHTTLHIVPKILETTSAFNDLDLDIRKCKLPHETAGFRFFQEYSQKACEIECSARKAMSFCRCLPWFLPNNFTSIPMCDVFGGYCFNEIMSNIIYYKKCKKECLEDCQEISLAMWHRSVPLNTEELCKDSTYFDDFFLKNFQKLFVFENYQMLVKEQSTLDLALSLSNGSLCMRYINKYIAFVSVESPTKSVTKSHRDQRKFFIDKLGIIGGTLGVSAGMSVLSMIEVIVFVYIILNGIFHDIWWLWKKMLSYSKGEKIIKKASSDPKTKSLIKKDVDKDELEEDQQEILKIYVSTNFSLEVYNKHDY